MVIGPFNLARLRPNVAHFFMSILPQNLCLLAMFLVLILVLRGAGEDYGIHNLINDSAFISKQISIDWVGRIWSSPSFWTSFFLFIAAFAIVVFSNRRQSVHAYATRVGTWQVVRSFITALGLYAILLVAWLTGEHFEATTDIYIRIGLGFAAASVVSIATIEGLLLLMRILDRILPRIIDWEGSSKFSNWMSDRARFVLEGRGANMMVVYPVFLALLIAIGWYKIIPAIAIFSLIITGFILLQIFFSISLNWRYGMIVLTLAGLMGQGLFNPIPSPPYKLSFAGISDPEGEDHYADPLVLDAVDAPVTCSDRRYLPVDALEALRAWRARYQTERPGAPAPKLVIVATSGGAYRSAYWTAMVLDQIAAESGEGGALEGMAQSIRLMTGASGGMVGAGYFAALADESFSHPVAGGIEAALDHDIFAFQEPTFQKTRSYPETSVSRLTTEFPVPGDSLSPVAQMLLQRDIPSILMPWSQTLDRGKVLEWQWETMRTSFADLAEGERQGWRPSLVISPTIVETGQPLLITNLSLGAEDGTEKEDLTAAGSVREAERFFDFFPCAHDTFQLSTAVRMNAAFPFVSPAPSLPTKPVRRVVDAGYYDNFGISLVAAYLSDLRIREWIKANTSGVIILELRAFPQGTETESSCEAPEVEPAQLGFFSAVETEAEDDGVPAFSWLTSPVEAAMSARRATMVFRNAQELRRVALFYPEGFVGTYVFVNTVDVSLNWYLPDDERAKMKTCFEEQWAANEAILASEWNGAVSVAKRSLDFGVAKDEPDAVAPLAPAVIPTGVPVIRGVENIVRSPGVKF